MDKLNRACDGNGYGIVLALATSYAAMLSSGPRDVSKFEWYPYAANARVLASGNEGSTIPICPGEIMYSLHYLALERKGIISSAMERDHAFKCLLDVGYGHNASSVRTLMSEIDDCTGLLYTGFMQGM